VRALSYVAGTSIGPLLARQRTRCWACAGFVRMWCCAAAGITAGVCACVHVRVRMLQRMPFMLCAPFACVHASSQMLSMQLVQNAWNGRGYGRLPVDRDGAGSATRPVTRCALWNAAGSVLGAVLQGSASVLRSDGCAWK